MRYNPTLDRHLRDLSRAHPLGLSNDRRWVIVRDFRLPPGFNRSATEILVEIPEDYPCSPPGIGAHGIFIRPGLRYRGKSLRDLHPGLTPGWGNWAWFCYERIDWDPFEDDLIKLLEMIRGDLTDPRTC